MKNAPFSKEVYESRRDALANRFLKHYSNSILIIFSALRMQESGDQFYPYTQNPDFFYYTGITEPGHALVMYLGNDSYYSRLFSMKSSKATTLIDGPRLTSDELYEISGIGGMTGNVAYIDDALEREVNSRHYVIYPGPRSHDPQVFKVFSKCEDLPIIAITAAIPALDKFKYTNNCTKEIHEQRMIKSSEEVALIKQSCEKTIRHLRNLLPNMQVGISEKDLALQFEFNAKRDGIEHLAFPPIVATGKSALLGHHQSRHDIKVDENDLISFDCGLSYQGYKSDLTRVLPVSGKFTSIQRDIYNAVLQVQKTVIEAIKPEANWYKICELAKKCINEELHKIGCIKEVAKSFWEINEVAGIFMPHGLGHMLGLDTHDVNRVDLYDITIKPGMVFAIEPGIYISDEVLNSEHESLNIDKIKEYYGLATRIEDVIVVTESGCEILTSQFPKEIGEIEKLMAQSR